MLRHNTSNTDEILREIPRIYGNVFRSIDGCTKPHKTKTTPGIPLEKYLIESIKKHCPMMVSTLELQKTPKQDVIISHHFVYGTHWHLNTDKDDQAFKSKLDANCKSILNTINDSSNNFLIQPVGIDDCQSIDRNDDSSIVSFIRFMDVLETLPELTDGELSDEEDNIILHFNKLIHPTMKYALHYSFTV